MKSGLGGYEVFPIVFSWEFYCFLVVFCNLFCKFCSGAFKRVAKGVALLDDLGVLF